MIEGKGLLGAKAKAMLKTSIPALVALRRGAHHEKPGKTEKSKNYLGWMASLLRASQRSSDNVFTKELNYA